MHEFGGLRRLRVWWVVKFNVGRYKLGFYTLVRLKGSNGRLLPSFFQVGLVTIPENCWSSFLVPKLFIKSIMFPFVKFLDIQFVSHLWNIYPSCSFRLVESTVFWSQGSPQMEESVQLLLCTPLPSWSTWPQKFWSWLAMQARIWRWSVSLPGICNWRFVVTKNSTPSSKEQ